MEMVYNTKEINPNTVFFGRRNAQRRTNLQEYEWRQVRPVAEARYAERIGARSTRSTNRARRTDESSKCYLSNILLNTTITNNTEWVAYLTNVQHPTQLTQPRSPQASNTQHRHKCTTATSDSGGSHLCSLSLYHTTNNIKKCSEK